MPSVFGVYINFIPSVPGMFAVCALPFVLARYVVSVFPFWWRVAICLFSLGLAAGPQRAAQLGGT
jgi:glucan phosphoethanolaminetransferase (alkaline phosphatase superfamily)